MKKTKQALLTALLCVGMMAGYGQVHRDTVYVSDRQVTSLIFQDDIELVRLGDDHFLHPTIDSLNREVLFLHPRGKLKESEKTEERFQPTNLFVKLVTREYFELRVFHDTLAPKCSYFALNRPDTIVKVQAVPIPPTHTVANKDSLLYREISHLAMRRSPELYNVGVVSQSMLFVCEEVKVLGKDSLTLIKVRVKNSSKKDFTVSAFGFDMVEKKDINSVAERDLSFLPLYVYPQIDKVAAKNDATVVFVFKQLSFTENRLLRVRVGGFTDKPVTLDLYLKHELFDN